MKTSARVACGIALVASLGVGEAGAVPLLAGLGGPSGYGLPEHCLHPTDDGSYAGPSPGPDAAPVPVDVRPAFGDEGLLWFGRRYASFYLNANGNITFRAPLAAKTPVALPVADRPMIAAWWADVDTRGGGEGRNLVCYHLEPERLVVTWHDVGYFDRHFDRVADFQLVVTTARVCGRADADVEFRYNRCEWASGDASGGVAAQVGLDAGNLRNYVVLPMSRTDAIRDVCRTSNVPGGPPGLWRFQIRGSGPPPPPPCEGSGGRCELAGRRGLCAVGVTDCERDRPWCRALFEPREERCNGLDDDCDGAADEGDALCPDGAACADGRCHARCDGSAPCGRGEACRDGVCREPGCDGLACPAGQRCAQGGCVGLCDGVVCPHGQRCVAGACADPCAGSTCAAPYVCDPLGGTEVGACVLGCRCSGCGAGASCRPDGRCADDACEGVSCADGSHCAGGRCRDDCEAQPDTRVCPEGEVCRRGRCEADRPAPPDASVDAAPVVDGAVEDAGTPGLDAATTDAGRPVVASGGCTCGVAGGSARGGRGALALVVLALTAHRRRRDERNLGRRPA